METQSMIPPQTVAHPERALAGAARALTWQHLPNETKNSIQRLFLDWVGSALAGASSEQAGMLERVMQGRNRVGQTAPEETHPAGSATAITSMARIAPLSAALINGAAGHVVEMDDLHNASIYHPATCVFPALLAAAEAQRSEPTRFLAAAVAGYEVSIRIGEALGPEHYVFFHTTGTAGTFGAALAVGHLLGLDEQQLMWAMGNAASQAAGLWQFLVEGSMSKQLHTAKAAYNGALAAYLAQQGFTGPAHALCGERGLLAATTPAGALATRHAYDEALQRTQKLRLLDGIRPATTLDAGLLEEDYTSDDASWPLLVFETFKTPGVSIKYHASCRHTHPSVDALLDIMRENHLEARDLRAIHAHVYTSAYERLKDVVPASPWAAKFSIPFCLAQAALRGELSLSAFTEEALADAQVRTLMDKVSLDIDPALDDEYPRFWPAWVQVETEDDVVLTRRVQTPKGDPENPVTDAELDAKFLLLASCALTGDDPQRLLERLRDLESLDDMTRLFDQIPGADHPHRPKAAQ